VVGNAKGLKTFKIDFYMQSASCGLFSKLPLADMKGEFSYLSITHLSVTVLVRIWWHINIISTLFLPLVYSEGILR